MHNFIESKFGNKFCQRKISKIKKLIDSSSSFTIVGMPGVGVTTFLKYVATRNLAHALLQRRSAPQFIYVDSYLLTDLSKNEFFRLLLKQLGGEFSRRNADPQIFDSCLNKLKELVDKYPKIVLIFNRFDQLHSIFDETFFSNIWALRNVNPQKIVIISTANKPLSEIAPQALSGGHMGVFSRVVYLKPYAEDDLQVIISTYLKNNLIENPDAIKLAKHLSAGHHQLLQLLLNSARLSNPLQDQFIKLQLKELYEFVSHKQKRVLQKIALNKKVENCDEYLIEIGLVKKAGKKIKLFTPLLAEYILQHHPKRLPIKEAKLFNLLKQNLGQVVSKEEIFDTLWPQDSKEFDKASEWALNSLIYRLKKNFTFLASGYVIENHKKAGYILFKD